MRYKCLCGEEWGGELDEDGYYSHGLCFHCLRNQLMAIYRKRQRYQGFAECFSSGKTECDQKNCLYYPICIEGRIK